MKTIENKIQTELPSISWQDLKTFQFNDLKENKNRDISKLKNAMVNEGFVFPFFIWKRFVLDGTGRFLALKELEAEGYEIKELAFVELNANNLQHAKKLALMASSRHGEITQKSFENFVLDLNLEEIKLDIKLPEIKLDIANLKLEETEEEIFPESELNQEIISQVGDLWELNEHRILCGDCLDKTNIQRLMNGKFASMVFIDPPYNLKTKDFCGKGNTQHKDFTKGSGELQKEQFTEFLKDIFKNLINISKDGSIHYVCMDWRHLREILNAGYSCYTELKNLAVWAKDQAGQGAFYRSQHELIFIFKNGKAKHTNNFELGQFGRTRSNVWKYPANMSFANPEREKENNKTTGVGEFANHPTPKPVNLVADCCLDCSDIGEIITDLFLGSGTSLIASQKTKRIFYGMEIEPEYISSSIKRWVKYMQKENLDFQIKKNGEIFNWES